MLAIPPGANGRTPHIDFITKPDGQVAVYFEGVWLWDRPDQADAEASVVRYVALLQETARQIGPQLVVAIRALLSSMPAEDRAIFNLPPDDCDAALDRQQRQAA